MGLLSCRDSAVLSRDTDQKKLMGEGLTYRKGYLFGRKKQGIFSIPQVHRNNAFIKPIIEKLFIRTKITCIRDHKH